MKIVLVLATQNLFRHPDRRTLDVILGKLFFNQLRVDEIHYGTLVSAQHLRHTD